MKKKSMLIWFCIIILVLMMSSCLEPMLVTSIAIISEFNQTTLEIGESLQMSTRIEPENAANKAVIWTVENSFGQSDRVNRAEINQNGVLTGLSLGTVIVKATALDGSAVKGAKAITIIEPVYTLTVEASPTQGGTTVGSGEYEQGKAINISATANEGYRFVNFTKDLVEISAQTPFAYTMSSENVTIVANFEEAISFQSPLLEQAVRDADGYTGQPNGPIFKEDVLGITELSCTGNTANRNNERDFVTRAKFTSLEGIQHLINLVWLDFGNNNVSDLSPLENLTNLEGVYLKGNTLSTLQPLIDNSGIGSGDEVDIRDNNLDLIEGSQDMIEINILEGRGVNVYYRDQ